MIDFLDFYTALTVWKNVCQESEKPTFPNWRDNVRPLLEESYEPLEKSLFGDAILTRKKQ